MSELKRGSPVTEVPAAESSMALAHFERLLAYETDCWDVHASLPSHEPGFVLVDVRSPERFREGHLPGCCQPAARTADGTQSRFVCP